MKTQTGFTITEVMVVVALLAIFASFIWVSLSDSSAQARDSQRQADLRNLQAAVELYKQENGRYPEGCNDTGNSWTGAWSGQIGSGYECGGNSSEYIEGLSPGFIPVLPTDPKLNDEETYSGYLYATNPEGTAYKIMALNTVESETVTYDHEFVRCGDMNLGIANACTRVPSDPGGGGSGYVYNTDGNTPNVCNTASHYNDTYAVWGGFAPGGGNPYRDTPKSREYHTERIHCK